MSSAGLVFKHFGREVISNAVLDNWGVTLEEAKLEKVYQKVYKKLILEVDALDNSVSEAETMRYYITTNLGSRIARMNPEWNAPPPRPSMCSSKRQ